MGGKAAGGRRVSWEEGFKLGTGLLTELATNGLIKKGRVCGSIRRMCKEAGDVDLVVVPQDLPGFEAWLFQKFGQQKNGKPAHTGLVDQVQVDFLVAEDDSWGAALMHMTGPKLRNIVQRAQAKKNGCMLNEKGLFKDGVRVAGENEQDIYEELGLEFLQPEER
jgi:DNA polymerase (family 10)